MEMRRGAGCRPHGAEEIAPGHDLPVDEAGGELVEGAVGVERVVASGDGRRPFAGPRARVEVHRAVAGRDHGDAAHGADVDARRRGRGGPGSEPGDREGGDEAVDRRLRQVTAQRDPPGPAHWGSVLGRRLAPSLPRAGPWCSASAAAPLSSSPGGWWWSSSSQAAPSWSSWSADRRDRAPTSGRRRSWSRCPGSQAAAVRSEEHTSELQSPYDLVCRLLLEKKNKRDTGSLCGIDGGA